MTINSSTPIRVGVIGVGYLGRIHAKIYASMPEINLVAVVDRDRAVADEVAEQYDCEAFCEQQEILDRVDAVSIVVPTIQHRNVAIPFLNNGIAVLLEKPIAESIASAKEVVEVAKSSGTPLLIGHLERFNAGVMALAQRASNPMFVEVHRLGTFVARATDVDVVIDLMIHDIDIVLTLIHSPIRSVSGMGTSVVTSHIDIANARIEFENGAVANFTASRISDKKFRRIRVFGNDCYLGLNFEDQQLDIAYPDRSDTEESFPRIVREQLAVQAMKPLDAEIAHFVECVRGESSPLVTGADGHRALEVAELVREKIQASRLLAGSDTAYV